MNPRRKGDVHRNLDAGAVDLTAPLGGMAVAEVEERTWHEHGQIDGDALPESSVVHVPAVRATCGARDGLPAVGRHTEAANHWVKRYPKRRDAVFCRHVRLQGRFPPLDVHVPRRAAAISWKAGHKVGIDNVARQAPAGAAPRSVRHDAVEADRQDIARVCATNKERPGLGVPADVGLVAEMV